MHLLGGLGLLLLLFFQLEVEEEGEKEDEDAVHEDLGDAHLAEPGDGGLLLAGVQLRAAVLLQLAEEVVRALLGHVTVIVNLLMPLACHKARAHTHTAAMQLLAVIILLAANRTAHGMRAPVVDAAVRLALATGGARLVRLFQGRQVERGRLSHCPVQQHPQLLIIYKLI